jgi:Ras-related protein Rab-28
MRAVKLDKHNQFADGNAMRSYFVSAKTGDNINTCFYRVAAELAGVSLTKAELEASSVRLSLSLCMHLHVLV